MSSKPPTLVALRGGAGTGSEDKRLDKVHSLAAQLAESLDPDESVASVFMVIVTSKGANMHGSDYDDSLRLGGAILRAVHVFGERPQ